MDTPIVVCVVLLALLALLLSHAARHYRGEAPVVGQGDCTTCDGTDAHCEQTCMMEAATKPVEYYDDEELDGFRGRSSDSYTDDEVEQFSEVLYTMRPDEVAGWCRSLTLRGIQLPDALKDEVLMLRNG